MNYDEAKAIAFEHVTPRVGEVVSEYAFPLRVVRINGNRVHYVSDDNPERIHNTSTLLWASRNKPSGWNPLDEIHGRWNRVEPTEPWPRR